MRYYHVWVRSERYRGNEALTYSHPEKLEPGAVVIVPLRSAPVPGVIFDEVPRPVFATKRITALTGFNLPPQSLELAEWIQQFYASPIGVIAGLFLPLSFSPKIDATTIRLSSQSQQQPQLDGSLTDEQQYALEMIDKPDTYLLHGRTGSGKTRIYIELTKRSMDAGRSALILCPEIGLTSQLAAQFRRVFGDRVIVLHSQLTTKQREIAWRTITLANDPLVVIGPRSALFSPLKNVGLVVVDESHDQAYKQEQPPYYEAARVAAKLRSIHDAILVLGSATPSLTDYYMAIEKHKPIIRLQKLARTTDDAPRSIKLVDLKDRAQFNRSAHISRDLIEAVAASLHNGEQSLLYLNRRGTARVTLCDVCGWQALCPRCDLPLTYHGDRHRLQCHTCGYQESPRLSCPECGNTSITLRSFGTKAIEYEIRHLFPEARVLRLDTDTTKAERLEQQYEHIIAGEVDILVGTQILTKGLDLPRLSTLGIILADSSLYLPDFTAQERTYQLLTQVMGRVGRGHTASQTIVQTYYPKSDLLHAALNDDWQTFYQKELAERQAYSFPPFAYLLKITCKRKTVLAAERAASAFQKELAAKNLNIHIDGPTPCFHEKVGGQYHWQLAIKSSNRGELLKTVKLLPNGWSYDLDPMDLL